MVCWPTKLIAGIGASVSFNVCTTLMRGLATKKCTVDGMNPMDFMTGVKSLKLISKGARDYIVYRRAVCDCSTFSDGT